MASYLTRIGDAQILLEAPASSALAKGGSEVKADPAAAITNIVQAMKAVAGYMGKEIGPVVRSTGIAMEVGFAVRADAVGTVMISESTTNGQFLCTVRFNPPPPVRPPVPDGRPPGAPPPRPPPPGAGPGSAG